ncbi:hypothetical protein COBT_003193, partial [Conglomerata obtusa]
MGIKKKSYLSLIFILSACLVLGLFVLFYFNRIISKDMYCTSKKKVVNVASTPKPKIIQDLKDLNMNLNGYKQYINLDNATEQYKKENTNEKNLSKDNKNNTHVIKSSMQILERDQAPLSNKIKNKDYRTNNSDIYTHNTEDYTEDEIAKYKLSKSTFNIICPNFKNSNQEELNFKLSTKNDEVVDPNDNNIENLAKNDSTFTLENIENQLSSEVMIKNGKNSIVRDENKNNNGGKDDLKNINNEAKLKLSLNINVDPEADDDRISQKTFMCEQKNACNLETTLVDDHKNMNGNGSEELQNHLINLKDLNLDDKITEVLQSQSSNIALAHNTINYESNHENTYDINTNKNEVPQVEISDANQDCKFYEKQNVKNSIYDKLNLENGPMEKNLMCQNVYNEQTLSLNQNLKSEYNNSLNLKDNIENNEKDVISQESTAIKILDKLNDNPSILHRTVENTPTEYLYISEVNNNEYTQVDMEAGVKKYKYVDQKRHKNDASSSYVYLTRDNQYSINNKLESKVNHPLIRVVNKTYEIPFEESIFYKIKLCAKKDEISLSQVEKSLEDECKALETSLDILIDTEKKFEYNETKQENLNQ